MEDRETRSRHGGRGRSGKPAGQPAHSASTPAHRPRIAGHPFDSAYGKLNRAREHLESLHGEIVAFEARHAYGGQITTDLKTGWRVLRVRVFRALPQRLGTHAGDYFTNLRAALDHAVYGIALASGTYPTRTQFPICSSASAFTRQSRRDLSGLPARWVPVFDALQPYTEDNRNVARHPLTLLRDYANADKHRLIHTALTVPSEHRLALEPVEPIPVERFSGVESWVAARAPLRDGDEILGINFARDPSLEFRVSGSMRLDVVFGDLLLGWGELDAIRRHTVEIVEALEEALGRAPPEPSQP